MGIFALKTKFACTNGTVQVNSKQANCCLVGVPCKIDVSNTNNVGNGRNNRSMNMTCKSTRSRSSRSKGSRSGTKSSRSNKSKIIRSSMLEP